MHKLLLRIMTMLLSITLVGVSLSLLVGRFMPADVLTTTISTVTLIGNRYTPIDTLTLIDINRHLRVPLRLPIVGVNQATEIHWTGEQVLIQTSAAGTHMYHYNILTDTLNEFPPTYTDPETGEVVEWVGIFFWMIQGDELWDYNRENRALYRIQLGINIIERVALFPAVETPSGMVNIYEPSPVFSPNGTQGALADGQTIYVFNTDGTNLRQYTMPFSALSSTYAYWSPQDNRYLYMSGFPQSPSAPMFFRILDVSTGEILPTTQNLDGESFSPCPWQDEWMSYLNTKDEGVLTNYQTGETINLSLVPELAGQSIQWVQWFNSCDWLLVTIGDHTNLGSIGFDYQPLYIVSRDGQTVHLLGETVTLLDQMEDNRLLVAEPQDGENLLSEIYFNGTVHRTTIGHFPSTANRMSALSGNVYRWLVYDDQNYVSLLDIRTGVFETYFAANESIDQAVYWRWE